MIAGAVVEWLCYLTHNQLIAQSHVFEPSWPNCCVCVFNPTRAGGRGGRAQSTPPLFFLFSLQWRKIQEPHFETFPKILWGICDMYIVYFGVSAGRLLLQ